MNTCYRGDPGMKKSGRQLTGPYNIQKMCGGIEYLLCSLTNYDWQHLVLGAVYESWLGKGPNKEWQEMVSWWKSTTYVQHIYCTWKIMWYSMQINIDFLYYRRGKKDHHILWVIWCLCLESREILDASCIMHQSLTTVTF